jgi:hypothetical protein
MGEKRYGKNKILYSLLEKPDGRLEVLVRHDNIAECRVIQANRRNSRYFLEHFDTYKDSSIRAKYWMAMIVSEYRSHFAASRVDFVFPSEPPKSEKWPAAAAGPRSEGPGQSTDIELVVSASQALERLLIETFRAQGKGLGDLLKSVERKLPPALRQELWGIARIRNRLVHEQHVSLRALGMSQDQFRQLCARAERGLRA